MKTPLRLVFMGSDALALPLLDWLAEAGRIWAEVVGVFTQPDRPVGRGQRVQANAIKRWAEDRGVPVFQPEKLTEAAREQLARLEPDVSLVMAYGHILREAFIATPRLGTLNVHASLLPRYRGASPIQAAVASGERETGVSLMRIVRALDAGPVAAQERVPIGERDTALEVEARLAAAGPRLLARTLPALARGELAFVAQDEQAATFCRRLTKADGVLDFAESAEVLAARIRGLHPWPGCTTELGGQPVKLGLADALAEEAGAAPGTVLGLRGEGILVATSRGVLRCLRLQRPGGRMLAAPEFWRGFSVPVGTVLLSHPMPPLVAPRPFPYVR